MYRSLIAACAAIACLALAAPASAQEPTVTVTHHCSGTSAMFAVQGTGFPANETFSAMVSDAEGDGHISASGPPTDATGAGWLGFGADIPNGTYTVYAYTGPYQTVAEVDSFDPSLTTAWASVQVEVACGPPSKDECKVGGFEDLGYRNQGQCVSARARQ